MARKTDAELLAEAQALDAAYARAAEFDAAHAPTPDDLVLCQSADGWSLHAPGSTDEAIASGDAPYLLSGTGEPTEADWQQAFERWTEDECNDDYMLELRKAALSRGRP